MVSDQGCRRAIDVLSGCDGMSILAIGYMTASCVGAGALLCRLAVSLALGAVGSSFALRGCSKWMFGNGAPREERLCAFREAVKAAIGCELRRLKPARKEPLAVRRGHQKMRACARRGADVVVPDHADTAVSSSLRTASWLALSLKPEIVDFGGR